MRSYGSRAAFPLCPHGYAGMAVITHEVGAPRLISRIAPKCHLVSRADED